MAPALRDDDDAPAPVSGTPPLAVAASVSGVCCVEHARFWFEKMSEALRAQPFLRLMKVSTNSLVCQSGFQKSAAMIAEFHLLLLHFGPLTSPTCHKTNC